MTDRPLSHIRVLDFGHYLAGPMVGMMLADLGAEVIRIDPPGGPRWRDPAFDMLSRGKRSLVLDLKTEAGRQTALDMVARADVVIDNFRPGVMARLGLGPADLRAANPGIVSLSLPGFASTDPELAGLAAWEAVIAARTGQFTDMGLNRQLMGINPSFTPLGLASAYGAAFGAMAVLFALGARDRTGGEHIEVPLASALFEGLVYNCEQVQDYPARYKSPREVELDRRRAGGLPLDLSYADLGAFLDPFYRTYTCADGRGFYVVSCSIKTHQRRALRALGLDDLAETLPDFDAYLDQKDWPAEWALRNYPVGDRDRKRVSDAMQAAFLTRPSWEWEAIFGTARIEVLCDQDPILLNGTTVAGRIDDATIPNDGQWFKQFYFHAVASDPAVLSVPAGGRAEVPIALRWNGDGAPCAHALALKLDSDAGYLPKRRLTTDANGVGNFVVEALGLSPGDLIAVKINTEHYTAIGKIILEVA